MLKMMMRVVAVMLAVVPATLHAKIVTEKIEYRDGDAVLEGFLAYDDSVKPEDRRPGVLVCHEWWGGGGSNAYAQSRAEQLAGLGYVAFALDMYGKGRNTDDPKQAGAWAGEVFADAEAMRRRAALGLKVLAEHERVDRERLAVIGYCMGGTVALELARSGLEHTQSLRVVVAFHASTLAAKGSAEEIMKANANIKGSVLVCHGAVDQFVKPGELQAFGDQMEAAKVDYQVVHYGGAVHSFTNPGADAHKMASVGYDEKADRRSWGHMRMLMDEKFK
jgi:dienelactone hydrolase